MNKPEENLFNLYEKLNLVELMALADNADSENEDEFYTNLYNLKLAQRQKELLKKDEFVM